MICCRSNRKPIHTVHRRNFLCRLLHSFICTGVHGPGKHTHTHSTSTSIPNSTLPWSLHTCCSLCQEGSPPKSSHSSLLLSSPSSGFPSPGSPSPAALSKTAPCAPPPVPRCSRVSQTAHCSPLIDQRISLQWFLISIFKTKRENRPHHM